MGTTIEDKRLYGYLKKKSKKSSNVYFNKRNSTTGASKYVQGKFFSKKNGLTFDYRSSYELAYLQQLEKNEDVCSYIYEPFEIGYIDISRSARNYRPDFMILFKNGDMQISEVKPTAMLADFNVRAKAKAAEIFLKENFKDCSICYKFITEKDLFTSDKEYYDFVKSVKNG